MKLPSFRFLRRYVATSGASGLCFALCLGLWSASSSYADSISDADATKIGNAVREALYGNDGYLFTMPLTDYETWEGFQWLLVDWENVGVGWNAGRINDILQRAMPGLTNNVADIVARLESGLFTGAQRGQLLTWLSDIQLWGEAPSTANGFRTINGVGEQAWSVCDVDANKHLSRIDDHVDEILSLLQKGGQPNWDGLQDLISGSILDASNSAKDSADIPDQTALANNALGDVRSTEHAAQTAGEEAEDDAKGALDSLVHETEFPFLGEEIPLLNDIDAAPTRTIARPATLPYLEDWVLVESGFRLVDEEIPGSIPLPEIALRRSATVTETSRPFLQWAGRITSALWALGFGVWILHVARSDWAFYTSGGGSDATMLAEQLEARRCLDINAALFSDSSLL